MFRSVIVDSPVIYWSSSQAGTRNIPRGKTSRKSCFKALCILCHPTFNELGDWFGCLLLQEIKSPLQVRQLSLTICSVPIFQRWEWAWKQMGLPSSVWDGICCCATPVKCIPWLERQQDWAPQQLRNEEQEENRNYCLWQEFLHFDSSKETAIVSRYYSWSGNPADSGQQTLGKVIHGLSSTLITTVVFTPLSHFTTFSINPPRLYSNKFSCWD